MHSLKLTLVAFLFLAGCNVNPNPPRPLAKGAMLRLYVVTATPTPGSIKEVDAGTNLPIYLTTPAIISAADVATAQWDESVNGTTAQSLTIHLTPKGAKKLAAATANPAGMQIALVINGNLIASPKIHSTLSDSFVLEDSHFKIDRKQLFGR